MRTRIVAILLLTFAAFATMPAPAHAEETMWQAWLASRPHHRKIEIGDAKPICNEYMGVGQESQLMDCLKKSIVGIDVVNAEARTGLINDVEWIIQWIVQHMQQYDSGTLAKLTPVADKLVEIATDPPVGLTQEDRKNLDALAKLLSKIDELEKRISSLEHPYAIGLNLGAYDLNANWVVGAEGCPLDLTFGRGAFALRGCVGGGVTIDKGDGILLVEGLFNLRVVQPVYLTLGYLYAQQPGSKKLKGADWVVSAGTLGGFVRPVSWFEIGGAAGVGQCDSRTTVGKETCFLGGFKASFRIEL